MVDATDPFSVTMYVLMKHFDLGASGKPSILVWNKCDMIGDDFHPHYLRDEFTHINVSAYRAGFEELKKQ